MVNGEYVKEVDSFMLTLKHKLSGARVLIFSNEDDNKVFDIAFRTPPNGCDRSAAYHRAYGVMWFGKISCKRSVCGTCKRFIKHIS